MVSLKVTSSLPFSSNNHNHNNSNHNNTNTNDDNNNRTCFFFLSRIKILQQGRNSITTESSVQHSNCLYSSRQLPSPPSLRNQLPPMLLPPSSCLWRGQRVESSCRYLPLRLFLASRTLKIFSFLSRSIVDVCFSYSPSLHSHSWLPQRYSFDRSGMDTYP